MSENNVDYSTLLARISAVALSIVLGTGIGAIVAGYLVIETGISRYPENIPARNILFLAGMVDLAATHFIKRYMLAKILKQHDSEITYQDLLPPSLVIAAMCSSISLYGLAAVVLGCPLDVLLLFVAVSLIGIQLFRIRNRDLESLPG